MTAVAIVFWVCLGLIVYAQVGYPLLLAALARISAKPKHGHIRVPPTVSLIIPAYDEEAVIAQKIANVLALDYPRDSLQVIVSCDAPNDRTAELARAAGADLVLELPRGGKVRAQDAAVKRATGHVLVFSDANSYWEPDALTQLLSPFADPRVGYVCGRVDFIGEGGTNQEGLYWRYEMALRKRESRLYSVTGGNGAIYATRKESYLVVDPIMGHDLSFPFNMVKRGWRALYAPEARAREKMVPTIEGEWARKRRMMGHAWPIVLRGGMLSPRGYPLRYLLMIASHRILRYATPFLHLVALIANAFLLDDGPVYVATFVAQAGLVLAALLGAFVRWRPLLVARYYVLTTAALGLGLWDWLRHGTEAGWDAAEGTR